MTLKQLAMVVVLGVIGIGVGLVINFTLDSLFKFMDARKSAKSTKKTDRSVLSSISQAPPARGVGCIFCGSTSRLEISVCCHRLVCPSHRMGDGSISSGYTCQDHPFGRY